MTRNQISYWENQETQRANRAQEQLKAEQNAETARTNMANEFIRQMTAESDKRYKEASASHDQRMADITRQNNDWRNILSTLGFVLPQADSVVKALASVFGG